MNNTNDIKSVMTEIHKTLNSLIESEISLDEANNIYHSCKEKSVILKNNHKTENYNLIKEILFIHNINNFCKLSFIYKKISDNIKLEESAGENTILDDIYNFVLNSEPDINISELDNAHENKSKVYTFSIEFKDFTLIFGAVTSSKLFTESRFLITTDIIKRIYEKQISSLNPFFIDYYNIRTGNATEFILNKLKNGFELYAHVYIFIKIYEIYSHSGRKNLESLSGIILETLQNNYPDASIHILSGGIFLVLFDKDDKAASKMPRIEFNYNNFPIIYNKIKLEILNETGIYKFWEDLYSFRIYSRQGD